MKKRTAGNQIKQQGKPSPEREVVRFQPAPDEGLTQQQVQSRVQDGLTNAMEAEDSKWWVKILCKNVFTYFNLIFFVLAAVLVYEGSYNNLTFLVVVLANTLIGIVQEVRAKRTLDHLKIATQPETAVIRQGKKEKISSQDLVLDDIAMFEAGDQICADATVCTGEVTVNEALVTGESNEIRKGQGDSLLSGSFVISGSAAAKLEQVGAASYAAQLTKHAQKAKKRQQPGMMRALTRLIQIIGIIILPVGVLMYWNQHTVLGLPEKISVENTAASLIGMIPEGLYLLASVALAASTIRLAKKETLVHDRKCIETLARVDVLCVDKTGTITEPDMEVEAVLPVAQQSQEECEEAVRSFARNMSADNETMRALKKYGNHELPDGRAIRVKGFSSKTKFSAVEFSEATLLLGAPNILLPETSAPLLNEVSMYESQGKRTLLLGAWQNSGTAEHDIFADEAWNGTLEPIALILFNNAVRPQAKETFEYFHRQNVAVKVISGDSPVTAAMAAEKAGIVHAESYVDASLLTEEELGKAADQVTVFGRVTPEQKQFLIQALKKQGHTVAMTGDGVNDVLALRDADCGIAVASGSDAAAKAADLVLLNSDFSALPNVVAEGRRVINNIQRSATLFLSKNIFSLSLSLISLISVSLYPLKPSQLSLISALMIGIPAFFLALEPNEELVSGKFLRSVLYQAFPAALTAVFIVQWTLLMTSEFHISPEAASTMCFLLYGFSAYLMLYYACKPFHLLHGILFGTMGAAFVAAVVAAPEWIQVVQLEYADILLLVPMALLTLPVDYFLHRLLETFNRLLQRIKGFTARRKHTSWFFP